MSLMIISFEISTSQQLQQQSVHNSQFFYNVLNLSYWNGMDNNTNRHFWQGTKKWICSFGDIHINPVGAQWGDSARKPEHALIHEQFMHYHLILAGGLSLDTLHNVFPNGVRIFAWIPKCLHILFRMCSFLCLYTLIRTE